MSRRTRRWMRLARLLVACVAFFIARPADARPSLDCVVLVTSAEAASVRAAPASSTETPARATRRAPAIRDERGVGRARCRGITRGSASLAPLVLVADKYLRHCALLR